MQVFSRPSRSRSRRGFTLIELLVVISIIAVLAALITPAVQSARRAARNLECKNNLSNLGKALANFESGTGYLPYFNDMQGSSTSSWIGQLLPYLDAQAIYEQLQQGTTVLNPANVYLKVLACPDDETALKVDGQTSYVANVGYVETTFWTGTGEVLSALATTHDADNDVYDWDDSGAVNNSDIRVSLASGVFHRPSGTRRMSSQLINSGDGNQFTIWVTENIQATNWYANHVRENGFGANVDIDVFVGNAAGASTPLRPLSLPAANLATAVINDNCLPNRQVSGSVVDGQFPRPSSRHTGTVNVLYADGRVQSMAETINKAVYLSLLTSEGTRNGQTVLDDSVF